MSQGDSQRSVKGKSRLSQRQCDNSEFVPKEELSSIFHQFICDELTSGTLDTPLARIKVDEQIVLE